MQHVQLARGRQSHRVLGKDQSAGMRSGFVSLAVNEHMHEHTTGGNEELLILLHGAGVVMLEDKPVNVAGNEALYIPPHTKHSVHNHGDCRMEYVYVVAPTR